MVRGQTGGMKRELLIVLLALACGAEADEAVLVEQAAPAAAEERPEVPLCEGSPEPAEGLCQSLRYGDRGYCNRWVDCASLP